MATSVRKPKKAKQSFEFVESSSEKDVIQVHKPPQDGLCESIHETMKDRVEHETHPFFVNKELLVRTDIGLSYALTYLCPDKSIASFYVRYRYAGKLQPSVRPVSSRLQATIMFLLYARSYRTYGTEDLGPTHSTSNEMAGGRSHLFPILDSRIQIAQHSSYHKILLLLFV